jgi:Do/DeqQ family serine protease
MEIVEIGCSTSEVHGDDTKPRTPAARGGHARTDGCGGDVARPRGVTAAAPAAATLADLVEKVGPAVVNISAEQRIGNPFSSDPLGQFFRDFFEGGRNEERVQNSLGSGVLIDAKGYILTNEHVISAASRVRVTLHDKREFWAEIVGTSQESDLAVLKISAKEPLPAIALGSSDDLMIGETVIAIGNPFGLSNTVTVGVVSAVHRSGHSGDRVYTDFVQTDAAINPGNSGGALLNINGELIGINAAIIGQAQGIGFAIPIDRARSIYRELVQYGEVRPIYLGLDTRALDERTAQAMGVAPRPGLVVVAARGPAADAGRRPGDVIVKADQALVESGPDLATAIGRKNVGDTIDLVVEREGGEKKNVTVKAAAFPTHDYAWRSIGIEVADIAPADKRRRDVPDAGVVISSVRPDGPAARRGLRAGDYIVQVLDAGVRGAADFNKLLPRIAAMQEGDLFLRVVRGGYVHPVSLRLD